MEAQEEEENINYNEIKEILSISPLLLLNDVLTNDKILQYCNACLPYSIGIEIEADYTNKPDLLYTYLLAHSVDNYEQRFRIPNGYKGLIALELIVNQLKYFLIPTQSGNHYHIDCTQNFSLMRNKILKSNILEQLDNWEYKGTYNKRNVAFNQKGNWVNIRDDFNTCEVRIGELAYDYKTVFKRIFELCGIIKTIRIDSNLNYQETFDNDININEIFENIKQSNINYKDYINNNISKLKNKEIKHLIKPPLSAQERVIRFY
jgi:hypothetical protein